MKNLFLIFGVTAVSLTLIAVAVAKPASSTSPKISLASTALGRILVDGRGHTLYLFTKDQHGKSTCAGACAGFWPPLIATGKPRAGTGVKAALLGTTRRADGRLQVTYNHHPLYTFAKDKRKGDTNGEELNAFGAEWYAVSAAGVKVANDNASMDAGAGGYGNGYGGGY